MQLCIWLKIKALYYKALLNCNDTHAFYIKRISYFFGGQQSPTPKPLSNQEFYDLIHVWFNIKQG